MSIKVELTPEATGYRDLFWCGIINEPFVVSYRDGEPYCDVCDGKFVADEHDIHEFLAHISRVRS